MKLTFPKQKLVMSPIEAKASEIATNVQSFLQQNLDELWDRCPSLQKGLSVARTDIVIPATIHFTATICANADGTKKYDVAPRELQIGDSTVSVRLLPNDGTNHLKNSEEENG